MTDPRDLNLAASHLETLRRVEHAHATGDQFEVARLLDTVDRAALLELQMRIRAHTALGDVLELPLAAA